MRLGGGYRNEAGYWAGQIGRLLKADDMQCVGWLVEAMQQWAKAWVLTIMERTSGQKAVTPQPDTRPWATMAVACLAAVPAILRAHHHLEGPAGVLSHGGRLVLRAGATQSPGASGAGACSTG